MKKRVSGKNLFTDEGATMQTPTNRNPPAEQISTHDSGERHEINDPFAKAFGYIPEYGYSKRVDVFQEPEDVPANQEDIENQEVVIPESSSGKVHENEQPKIGVKQVRRKGKSRSVSSDTSFTTLLFDQRKTVTLVLDGELLRRCKCLELYHNRNFSELVRWLITEKYETEKKDILNNLPKILGFDDIQNP